MQHEKTWKCPKCEKLGAICKICEKSLLIKTEESFKEKPQPLPDRAFGAFDGPRRRSKWDDDAAQDDLMDTMPLPCLEERMDGPIGFKVVPLDQVQVRTLIGRGGETIKDIRRRVGEATEVIIQHQRTDESGIVRITGNVYQAEMIIKEKLKQKGCLVNRNTLKTNADIRDR